MAKLTDEEKLQEIEEMKINLKNAPYELKILTFEKLFKLYKKYYKVPRKLNEEIEDTIYILLIVKKANPVVVNSLLKLLDNVDTTTLK